MNTAIESDDGNPALRGKAKRAMTGLLSRLERIVEEGQKRGEIANDVDAKEVVMLIVSTLEGSMMVRRLQGSDAALRLAVGHLEDYLEEKVRS